MQGFDCGVRGSFDEHRGSSGRGNRVTRPLASVVEGNERSIHAGAAQEGAQAEEVGSVAREGLAHTPA